MMLALGFEHGDSLVSDSQTLSFDEHLSSFAKIRKIVLQFCSIDKFSVMSADSNAKMETKDAVKIWKLDKKIQAESKQILNENLSELDKVALNILYPPVKIPGKYEPKLGDTGLYYCNRQVMNNHNSPKQSIQEVCGPKLGINCPACRTISSVIMNQLNTEGIVQAWSGMFFCGQKMKKGGKDKVDKWNSKNPRPWDSCLKIFHEVKGILEADKGKSHGWCSWLIF